MVKKRNNKGFTMIEIIVTLAIMAIVTAGAISMFSWISRNKIRSMAGDVNTAIGDTRSRTLSKGGTFELIIKKESDDYVAIIKNVTTSGTTTEKKKISDYGTISVESGTYKVGSGCELHISFNKSDGSIKEMAVYSSETAKTCDFNGEILFEYSNLSKKIKLVKLTGKHYLE